MTSCNREKIFFNIAFIGIVLTIISTSVNAEATPWKLCNSSDENAAVNCTIDELQVTPCQEKPCRIKRGQNATIEFSYTTNFESPTLQSHVFWTNNFLDLPFIGLEENACLSTACPTTPGEKQTYRLALPISKKYPPRSYDVKWKLESPEKQGCCFIFKIRIYK